MDFLREWIPSIAFVVALFALARAERRSREFQGEIFTLQGLLRASEVKRKRMVRALGELPTNETTNA